MISRQTLLELSQAGIVSMDASTLTDIAAVTIDQGLPHEEKIASYISQLGNPYCFLSGGVPVRMRFVAEDRSLSQALIRFFSQLK